MKTAISVPDDVFVRADAYARRLGLSRSDLYVRALEAFLGPPGDGAITAQLDAVYADQTELIDPDLRRAQIRAVGDSW